MWQNRSLLLLLMFVLSHTEWTTHHKQERVENSQIETIPQFGKQYKILLYVWPTKDFTTQWTNILSLNGVIEIAHATGLRVKFGFERSYTRFNPLVKEAWTRIEVSQTFNDCQYLLEVNIENRQVHRQAKSAVNQINNVGGQVNPSVSLHINNLVIESSNTGNIYMNKSQ